MADGSWWLVVLLVVLLMLLLTVVDAVGCRLLLMLAVGMYVAAVDVCMGGVGLSFFCI